MNELRIRSIKQKNGTTISTIEGKKQQQQQQQEKNAQKKETFKNTPQLSIRGGHDEFLYG